MTEDPTAPKINLISRAKGNGSTYSVGQGTQNIHHHYSAQADPLSTLLSNPSTWPYAGDANAILFGVHRAPTDGDGNAIPPYVRRDLDEHLRGIIQRLSKTGGMVLLVGDSTAGKTRSAFQAISTILPDYRLAAPNDEQELSYIIGALINAEGNADSTKCILWLDDLERFLGSSALTPTSLSALTQRSVVVVATMQARLYHTYAPSRQGPFVGDSNHHASRAGNQILECFTILFLQRLWSDAELKRASEVKDSRVADALAHGSEYGIAEYLAAGPQLLQEWQAGWAVGANPRGAALVAAAVDYGRTGVHRSLSVDLIFELHDHYLQKNGGSGLRPESREEALDWATQLRHGTSSLLIPVRSGIYRVFDYLPDSIARNPEPPPIPDQVWLVALNVARANPCKCCVNAIGHNAEHQRRDDVAWTVWHAEAESGDSHAAFEIGTLLEKKGDLTGADSWYRRSAEGGNADAMNRLAFLAIEKGDERTAQEWWKQAIAAGKLHAAFHLASQLEQIGDPAAEEYYRQAASSGDGHACFHVGVFAEGRSAFVEAEEWYRKAVELGDSTALNNLGVMLQRKGDLKGAEQFWKMAFAEGDKTAARNLATLYMEIGNSSASQEWRSRASES